MIKIDENDPIGEVDPSFPYRDVKIKKNTDMKEFYNLQKEIGRGKFGTVYRCIEKSTELELAAKFISIAKRTDRRNAEREVEIMRELQHPRLIQMYDAYEINNTMCVILELIEGGELFERVIDDDFVLTEKSVSVFMKQICEGVAFIHSKNIIHLDMKPENILCLTRNGNRIKVIDFGLARKYDPDKKLQVLFGTPEFVAPEVVNFDSISFGTDMWSVGVICYVLLSGLSPFMGETDVQTMSNVTIAQYDFDDESFDDISADAKDFISKLLVKDKEARMTATECLSHRWLRQEKSIVVENDVPNTIIKNELDYQKDSLRYIVDRWNDDTKITPVVEDGPQPLSATGDKFNIVITNGNVTKNEEKSKLPETNHRVILEDNKTLHQNSIHSAPSLSSFQKMDIPQDTNHAIQEQSQQKTVEAGFKMVNGNQSEVDKVSTELPAAHGEASMCNISCKHKDSRKQSTPNGLLTMDSASVSSSKNSKTPEILELSTKNIPEMNNDESDIIATLVNTSRMNAVELLADTGKPYLKVKAKVMSDKNSVITEMENSVKTKSENSCKSPSQIVYQATGDTGSDIIAEVDSTSKINESVPLSTEVEPKVINDKSDVSVQVRNTAKTKEIKPVPILADTVKSSPEVLIQVSSDTSELISVYDATSKIIKSVLPSPKAVPKIITEISDIITEGTTTIKTKVNKSASTSTKTAKSYPKTLSKLLPSSKDPETECIELPPTSLDTTNLSPKVSPKLIHTRNKKQQTPEQTIENPSSRVIPKLTIDATEVTATVDRTKTAKTELPSIPPEPCKSPPNVFSKVSDDITDVTTRITNTKSKEFQSIPTSAKQRSVNSFTTKKPTKSKSISPKINGAEVISEPKTDLSTKSTRSTNLAQSTEQFTKSSPQTLDATCTLSKDSEINVEFEIGCSDLNVKQSTPISKTKSSHPETKKGAATIAIEDGPCERVKKRTLVIKSIVENQQRILKQEEKHSGKVGYLLDDDDEENPSDRPNVALKRRISDITSLLSRTDLVHRSVEEQMAALCENLHKIVRLRQNSFSKPSSAASPSSESCSSKRPKYRVSYFSRDVPFSNATASCHAANLLSYFSLDSDEDGIINANERLSQRKHQTSDAWKRMFQFEGGRKYSLHSDPGSLRESPERFTPPSMTRKLFSKFFGDSMEYDLVSSPTHPLKRAKDKITELIS